MKKSVLILVVISAFAIQGMAFDAKADTPTYDFIQFSKANIDFDGGAEPDGFELKWNKSLSDNYYFNLDYSDVEDGPLDLQITNVGFGYKSDVSNYSSFFAQLDWSKFESNAGLDDTGYKASVGFKTQWTKNLETKAAYEYLDIDDDSNSIFVLGGAYQLTDNFALTLEHKNESDFDQTNFGVRYQF